MARIQIQVHASIPPERVFALATDFSQRRGEIFPAVQPQYFEVHSLGETSADATEGTKAGPMFNWERCDYDWSKPGLVLADVTDSNIYRPEGSWWELRATADGDGSRVEMAWERVFRRTPKGLFLAVVFRTFGKTLFGDYARETVANMETLG
jgi:hypothetical protein